MLKGLFLNFRVPEDFGLPNGTEPVKNGKPPGGDFRVDFKDITPQEKPPPSPAVNRRKSKYDMTFITV